jgi:1-acyl-sn-glycerol-3-phosphate acyltransferase
LPDNIEPLPFDLRERKRYYFHATPVRKILTPVIKTLFLLVGDLRVNGTENLPTSGPVILAANHLTNYDVFLMQFAIPRPIFFMGKEELFRNPLVEPLLRQLGGFPVQRGARDEWALRHAQKVLENGQVLGIFPEGKRSEGRGLLPAKTGAARLAITTGSPVVLMALEGTQQLLKNGLRRTPVNIRLSHPVYARHNESPLDFTDRLMFLLASRLPPHLRGVYAVHPPGFRD